MEDREKVLAILEEKAQFCRTETVRLIGIAKSGHYGSVFSAAEILATLYYHVLLLTVLPVQTIRQGWFL